MTSVKFENYIVVGSNEFSERMSKYAINDHVFFPIGTPIPIIIKGSGCPAFAVIDTIKFDKYATTIFFKIKDDVSKDTRASAYTMYRNAEGFENNSSSEDSVFGVYRSKTTSSSSSKKAKFDDDDDDMTYRPKWLK